MSLITMALNGAVGRYLTIDLQKNSIDSANKTFNTALFGILIISLISIPFLIGFVFFVPKIFDIPSGQEIATQILFFFVMSSFFVTTIGSSFSISTWAKSRFDLRNAVIIPTNIIRVLVVVILFRLIVPSIWIVGLGIFISSLFGLFGDIYIWKRLTPELKISPRKFDLSRIRELTNMGGWMVISQIGTLLILYIDLVVANIMLGPKVAGEYGTLIQFSALLRGVAGTVAGVLTPIVLAKYAVNDLKSITSLSLLAVRLMGIAIGFLVGLICGFGKPFLELWLGADFGRLGLLLAIIVFHLPINLAVLPLIGIQITLNKVKIPGLVTLVMGVVNILLAIFFIKFLNMGAYGIAAAGAIVLTLIYSLFTSIYTAYIQNYSWKIYLKALFPGILVPTLVGSISWFITTQYAIRNWLEMISIGSITGIVCVIIIYLFILNLEDKKFLLTIIPRRFKR
jgi:membrane protein EpsK